MLGSGVRCCLFLSLTRILVLFLLFLWHFFCPGNQGKSPCFTKMSGCEGLDYKFYRMSRTIQVIKKLRNNMSNMRKTLSWGGHRATAAILIDAILFPPTILISCIACICLPGLRVNLSNSPCLTCLNHFMSNLELHVSIWSPSAWGHKKRAPGQLQSIFSCIVARFNLTVLAFLLMLALPYQDLALKWRHHGLRMTQQWPTWKNQWRNKAENDKKKKHNYNILKKFCDAN